MNTPLSLMRASVDQMKAMVRDELRELERQMGIEEGMSTVGLVEMTSSIAETGDVSHLRPGSLQMIGMLAFIGIAQLHDEHCDARGESDAL